MPDAISQTHLSDADSAMLQEAAATPWVISGRFRAVRKI